MSNRTAETCMVFVDNSNMWIEAQKVAALGGSNNFPKLTDADRDTRHRIDIGKLMYILLNGREQGPSYLYGSYMPPNDSVWAAYRNMNFKINTFGLVHGKEKQVDNAMATDLTKEATEMRVKAEMDPRLAEIRDSTIFVVVTGDRDMLPPVKEVIKCGIRVELWAWKQATSHEYTKLAAQDAQLSVNYLDRVSSRMSYTNFRSTEQRAADPTRTLVFWDKEEPLGLIDSIGVYVCNELIRWGLMFHITHHKIKTAILVEFQNVDLIDPLIQKAQDRFAGSPLAVLSYPEFRQICHEDPQAITSKINNMFGPLSDEKEEEVEAVESGPAHSPGAVNKNIVDATDVAAPGQDTQHTCESDEAEGFQVVRRYNASRNHRRSRNKTQQCSAGIRCDKRGECGFCHDESDLRRWQSNPNVDYRFYKMRMCIHYKNCWRGKDCSFAHSVEEVYCVRCRGNGHCQENCPTCDTWPPPQLLS